MYYIYTQSTTNRQTRTQHLNSNIPNHSHRKNNETKQPTVFPHSLYKYTNHTANVVQYTHTGCDLIWLKGDEEEMCFSWDLKDDKTDGGGFSKVLISNEWSLVLKRSCTSTSQIDPWDGQTFLRGRTKRSGWWVRGQTAGEVRNHDRRLRRSWWHCEHLRQNNHQLPLCW